MPHDTRITWADLERQVQNTSRSLIDVLTRGNESYNDGIAYRGAMTVAEMATQLSGTSGLQVTEDMVNDYLNAITAFKHFYDLGNNQSITPAFYFDVLRKFI